MHNYATLQNARELTPCEASKNMTIVEMEHMQDSSQVIATLDQEIVVLTLTTVVRLFELDPDAATLYLFYCKTAKLQAQQIGPTNKIKATRDYCLKGLRWGHKRFQIAKKILLDNSFVEDIQRKNQMGNVEGWYVQINYLPLSYKPQGSKSQGGSYKPHGSKPGGGFWPPNADNKNISADNKNIQVLPTQNTTGHTVPRKKSEKSHSKVSRSNGVLTVDTMVPLTAVELWEIANKKNVTLKAVQFVHEQVLDMIRDGNKYKSKTIGRTVQKWVDLGVQRGDISRMNEVERMLFELDSPQNQQAFVEIVGKLKEKNLI